MVWLLQPTLSSPLPHDAPLSSTFINDTTILQFMVLLEHVENTFYHTFMDKFDDTAFQAAGFAPWVRGRYVQIVEHEDVHLRFLEATLGKDAPLRCTYQL